MKAVIDTNVLLVANAQHPDVSPACMTLCIETLQALQLDGQIVIDSNHEVLSEYLEKTRSDQPKGIGDVFLKWLLQQLGNPGRVIQVTLTPDGNGGYAEFPDQALQQHFDPPDRKFPAVANAHPDKPPILQASDCKWLDWWQALALYGLTINFLCPDDVCRYYRHKFPERKLPSLPDAGTALQKASLRKRRTPKQARTNDRQHKQTGKQQRP